jgi:hypothetical protein
MSIQTLVRFHLNPDWVPFGRRQVDKQARVVFSPHDPAVLLVGPGHVLTHIVEIFYA